MAATNKHIHTYLINEMVVYNIIVLYKKEHVQYNKNATSIKMSSPKLNSKNSVRKNH